MPKKENKHVYYTKSGKEIPSVTHIIQILAKPELTGWANWLGFKRISVTKFLNDKAYIGTAFHNRVECYFGDKVYQHPMAQEVDRKVEHLFQTFLPWAKEVNPKVIYQEHEYTCDDYGGKIDMLAKIKGEVNLIDFKTSKDIHPSQFLQLGGYLNLIEKNDPKLYNKITCCQIIAVTEEKVKVKAIFKKDMLKYQTAFNCCLSLYKAWNDTLEEDWGKGLDV